jgi:hypothetical protein
MPRDEVVASGQDAFGGRVVRPSITVRRLRSPTDPRIPSLAVRSDMCRELATRDIDDVAALHRPRTTGKFEQAEASQNGGQTKFGLEMGDSAVRVGEVIVIRP